MKLSFIKTTSLIFFVFGSLNIYSQNEYISELNSYREETDNEFKDPKQSPLTKEDLIDFKGLNYFAPNENFKIEAQFSKKIGKKFEMKTSTARTPIYQKLGELSFVVEGKDCVLSVYKNIELSKKEVYKDYLFIPFQDLTNGKETYGGGRYLDMNKPKKGQPWIIDFNKAYNPYCAYNYKYSCPIPPEENQLKVEIRAGVLKLH